MKYNCMRDVRQRWSSSFGQIEKSLIKVNNSVLFNDERRPVADPEELEEFDEDEDLRIDVEILRTEEGIINRKRKFYNLQEFNKLPLVPLKPAGFNVFPTNQRPANLAIFLRRNATRQWKEGVCSRNSYFCDISPDGSIRNINGWLSELDLLPLVLSEYPSFEEAYDRVEYYHKTNDQFSSLCFNENMALASDPMGYQKLYFNDVCLGLVDGDKKVILSKNRQYAAELLENKGVEIK